MKLQKWAYQSGGIGDQIGDQDLTHPNTFQKPVR